MDQDFTLTIVLDEHKDNNQNWRPLHQCLLMLFDSPLNHAGSLETFIRLANGGRLIRLHREVRIPRTFKRFEQLFINFLEGCDMPLVQTKDGQARLFQFAGRSLEKVLPNNCARYRIVNLTARVKSADFLASPVETNKKQVIFIEFGPVDFNFLGDSREAEYEIKVQDKSPPSDTYSISHYPLSPSLTCVKVLTAFEKALEIF